MGFYSNRQLDEGTSIFTHSNHFGKDREAVVKWSKKISPDLWRVGVEFLKEKELTAIG